MPYKRQSPLPMMVAGKKQLENNNPPPEMVQLDTTPQVRGGAGLLGFIGGSALKAGQTLLSGASRLFRSFTNAPKQYMKPYKVDGKLYGHFTKDGKLTNKYVPTTREKVTGMSEEFFKKVAKNNPNATNRTSGVHPFIQGTGRIKDPLKRFKNGQ